MYYTALYRTELYFTEVYYNAALYSAELYFTELYSPPLYLLPVMTMAKQSNDLNSPSTILGIHNTVYQFISLYWEYRIQFISVQHCTLNIFHTTRCLVQCTIQYTEQYSTAPTAYTTDYSPRVCMCSVELGVMTQCSPTSRSPDFAPLLESLKLPWGS